MKLVSATGHRTVDHPPDRHRGFPICKSWSVLSGVEEFYQIDNPERDRGRGLGMGLAIVRRLCNLLEHQLELRNLAVELLGRAAELHPAQLGELGLVLLNQDARAGQFRPRRGQFGLAFGKPGTKLGE